MPQDHFPRDRRPAQEARIRRGMVRISSEAAFHAMSGHPFIYRDSLGNRAFRETAGEIVDVTDPDGRFVARGYYDPDGAIAVRILTYNQQELITKATFLQRVREARLLRDDLLPDSSSLTAYRIIHGEGDLFPGVTVDRYGDYMLMHLYTPAFVPLLDMLCDALEEVWKPKAIYAQKRYRSQTGEGPKEAAELLRGSTAPIEIEVTEGNLRFLVDVTAPLGTGLFPDLRAGRNLIAAHSKNKRVLNLFSYTGAISIYAAAGGATEVVSVDLSAKAHARARRNLQLNHLPEQAHEFIAGDTFAVLARFRDRKRAFDVVILDPPPFSQAHGRSFTVFKDYAYLVENALHACAQSSLLFCASNAVKFSREEMEVAIGEAAGRAGRQVRIVERAGLPPDFPVPVGFPEGDYLKFLCCAVA